MLHLLLYQLLHDAPIVKFTDPPHHRLIATKELVLLPKESCTLPQGIGQLLRRRSLPSKPITTDGVLFLAWLRLYLDLGQGSNLILFELDVVKGVPVCLLENTLLYLLNVS